MHTRFECLNAFITKIRLFFVIIVFVFGFVCALLIIKEFAIGRDGIELSSLILKNEDINQITRSVINPNSEVRGIWIASVANINFPSSAELSADEQRTELDEIIATVYSLGINSIYFQVRPSCDSLYKSEIFPISEWLSTDGSLADDFDPLSYIVDEAHKRGISVHAWINPLRITYKTYDSKDDALNSLHTDSPALKDPDWSVYYSGKLYFDPGIPEVRDLIADGVYEIVEKYDVDGIIFDDYFYPYPVPDAKFCDNTTYLKYGSGFENIDDWRRNNINLMIEQCYHAVKTADATCLYGVAPFGIWQNISTSSEGSRTNGLEAYSAIYCDAVAWIRGGYIDYISPQLYWQFSNSAASFDILTEWWNKQLEGTDIKLIISHAAYNSEVWESYTEIREQVEFARESRAYAGSIFYGYEAIYNNSFSLKEQISSLYVDEIIYTDIVSDGSTVHIESPISESTISDDFVEITGSSDPGLPLYCNGSPVGRTKTGRFSVYVKLKSGKNEFVFTQNNADYKYILNKSS